MNSMWWLAISIYVGTWIISGVILFNMDELQRRADRIADKFPLLIVLMIASLQFGLVLTCLSLVSESLVPKLVSSFKTPFTGALGMKWFLFRSLFLVAFGFTASETQMISKAYQWFIAPPPPPSAEAQKLIASLNRADQWSVVKQEGKSFPRLKSGNVLIKPDNFWADVFVNETDCNGQFTVNDLKAINRAAESCLRKLATKAMNETVADSR